MWLDKSPSTRRSVSAMSFVIEDSISERLFGSGGLGVLVGVDGAEVEAPSARPRLDLRKPSIGLAQGYGRIFSCLFVAGECRTASLPSLAAARRAGLV